MEWNLRSRKKSLKMGRNKDRGETLHPNPEDSWGPGLDIVKSLTTPDLSHWGHISAAPLMATCLLMESGKEVGRWKVNINHTLLYWRSMSLTKTPLTVANYFADFFSKVPQNDVNTCFYRQRLREESKAIEFPSKYGKCYNVLFDSRQMSVSLKTWRDTTLGPDNICNASSAA